MKLVDETKRVQGREITKDIELIRRLIEASPSAIAPGSRKSCASLVMAQQQWSAQGYGLPNALLMVYDYDSS